ncbi:hypothetical protein MCOR29_008054 [Pyricularia oryzae]|nr:hypothetical protein MCOR19_003131 [Pyricularia oryzae]KAI6265784.1 hypothetical protein MCOR26_010546 [Pyricularia oryzae]KAI6312326.1 hypothetical protein MCOR29_008054 [Pyricularia oryzae]KAI6315824.1 hypothetical protein MCOR34_004530 [Pyricularia oryzae]KAI6333688.1 hypothetical protein MCOR28_010378 [Pyricularia oryzae]
MIRWLLVLLFVASVAALAVEPRAGPPARPRPRPASMRLDRKGRAVFCVPGAKNCQRGG